MKFFEGILLKNKNQIGAPEIASDIKGTLLSTSILIENKVDDLKVMGITDYKEFEDLLKDKSLHGEKILMWQNAAEVFKITGQLSSARERYPCPNEGS